MLNLQVAKRLPLQTGVYARSVNVLPFLQYTTIIFASFNLRYLACKMHRHLIK